MPARSTLRRDRPGDRCRTGWSLETPGERRLGPSMLKREGRQPKSSLAAGDLGLEHDPILGVLLDDRDEPRIEEPDLEQHEEWHRPVNLVGERVEDRRGEVESQRQLDERLYGHRLPVSLP